MRRLLRAVCLALAVGCVAPSIALAQQSVNFYLGGFSPRGLDARQDADVLVTNLFNGDDSLDFRVSDFSGGTVGIEWLKTVGSHLEAGVGLGFYRKTVPSVYAFLVEDNGTEIEQDLRLRVVPLNATIRLLPFGRDAAIQPYIGAGVGIFAWRYSEVGEFVATDGTVYQDRFIGSGTAAGPVILGGLRFTVGAGTIGGEVRYRDAEGDLPIDQFLGTTVDLSGVNYLLTFAVRF
jgi:hypothetical protein